MAISVRGASTANNLMANPGGGRRSFLVSALSAPALIACAGPGVNVPRGRKTEVMVARNDRLSFEISTRLEFNREVALYISRLLDFVLAPGGAYASKTPPPELRYLLEEPYRIFGRQISTEFSSIEIANPKRTQSSVEIAHTISAPTVTLSSLLAGAPSLTALLQAKAAEDYRWTVAASGVTSFNISAPDRIKHVIDINLTVDQWDGLQWRSPDRGWTTADKALTAKDSLMAKFIETWPRTVEKHFGLPSGSIQVIRERA